MHEDKLNQLFQAARKETAPAAPADFATRVTREIRRGGPVAAPTLFDQLSALFPRVAMASVMLVALCVVLDVCFSTSAQADLSANAAQLSDQWLFGTKGF